MKQECYVKPSKGYNLILENIAWQVVTSLSAYQVVLGSIPGFVVRFFITIIIIIIIIIIINIIVIIIL